MASINDLPTELLLDIFESKSLSIFDLLRLSATSSRWRQIIQTSSPMQERLWFRCHRTCAQSRKVSSKPDHMTINVVVRKIPATIWNDFQESLWEMTWYQDEESETIPWPRNQIVTKLEEFLHIVNPAFIHQPPYSGCRVHTHTSAPKNLVFCCPFSLDKKAATIHTSDRSWQKMLISQHLVTKIDMLFNVTVRHSAQRFSSDDLMVHRYLRPDRGELKMEDLVYFLQRGLVHVAKVLHWYLNRNSLFSNDTCTMAGESEKRNGVQISGMDATGMCRGKAGQKTPVKSSSA